MTRRTVILSEVEGSLGLADWFRYEMEDLASLTVFIALQPRLRSV